MTLRGGSWRCASSWRCRSCRSNNSVPQPTATTPNPLARQGGHRSRSVGNASSSVAVACFRTIARRELIGAAPVMLQVLPLFGDEFVLAAARDALKCTSRVEDVPLLRKVVFSDDATEVRVAAVVALAAAAGDAVRGDLLPLAEDWVPRVKLAAACALADRGDRACLAPLVDLLWADDLRCAGSIWALRGLTGRRSDYAAWVEPVEQPAAVCAWELWLASDEARTAPLTYPLRAGESSWAAPSCVFMCRIGWWKSTAAGGRFFGPCAQRLSVGMPGPAGRRPAGGALFRKRCGRVPRRWQGTQPHHGARRANECAAS